MIEGVGSRVGYVEKPWSYNLWQILSQILRHIETGFCHLMLVLINFLPLEIHLNFVELVAGVDLID